MELSLISLKSILTHVKRSRYICIK